MTVRLDFKSIGQIEVVCSVGSAQTRRFDLKQAPVVADGRHAFAIMDEEGGRYVGKELMIPGPAASTASELDLPIVLDDASVSIADLLRF